jgi:haloacetate dehalogenase
MWHKVAPALAEHFQVVAADLRGYGASDAPPAGDDGMGYAKRTMARDLVGLMVALGHERFRLAGHDRGARVCYRLALDHPERALQLAVLDVVPTLDTWEQMSRLGGLSAYHWYFLAQKPPFPEHLIGADPVYFLRHTLDSWCGTEGAISEEAFAEYAKAFDADTIRASCDDYRAGATIDRELDAADREAGRRIECPMLALWGDPTGKRPSLLDTWRRWATDVRGRALPAGHFLPEEVPEAVVDELLGFFATSP